MEKKEQMRQMVDKLNTAAEAYYNGKGEIMTDYEWDQLFDQLKALEKETGIVLEDSPTMFLPTIPKVRKRNMSLLLFHLPRQKRPRSWLNGLRTVQYGSAGSSTV